MAKVLEAASISEIPRVKELLKRNTREFATLPVVLLAFKILKSGGILLVSDFTSHPDSGFAADNSPKFFPRAYVVGKKRVEKSEILAIGVRLDNVPTILTKLRRFCPQIEDYNLQGEEFDISGLCIFAVLNFKIHFYRNCLEGLYSHIALWNNGANAGPQHLFESRAFRAFLERLSSVMDEDLRNHVGRLFPLEQYVPISHSQVNDTSVSSADLSVPTQTSLEGLKKRRLDPRAAIFQQQFTQGPTENGDNSQTSDTSENNEITGNTLNAERSAHIGATSRTKERMLLLNSTVWKSRNAVGFDLLCDIECHKLPDNTSFDTTAVIAEISPRPQFIFVRPFGRTLKISPFRICLVKDDNVLFVEASSEEELCSFFGIEEVEVAISHIGQFVSGLDAIMGTEARITVEKRVRELATGHELPYWGISSTLESLVGNIRPRFN